MGPKKWLGPMDFLPFPAGYAISLKQIMTIHISQVSWTHIMGMGSHSYVLKVLQTSGPPNPWIRIHNIST